MTAVGFTGTRTGMTPEQREQVGRWLDELQPDEAHHGDCVGADREFHSLCFMREIPIVAHPPEDSRHRAFSPHATRLMPPRPYLERNRDIVNVVDTMIAAPKESEEPVPARGQGTWSAIRYARKAGKPVRVAWPGEPTGKAG